MNSPPKRPRTSEGAAAFKSALPLPVSRPTRQPSFRSPTRSSLAKAYPDVLERAISRSPSRRPTERGGSRSSLSGIRGNAVRPSLGGSSSPLKNPSRLSGGQPILSPSRKPSGIQSFTKPPRRLSNKIKPGDFFFGSPTRRQTQPAEENLTNTPEGQLAQELGSATREAESGASFDIGFDGALDVGFADDDPLEPDLPPTPTQLGLEKAPDRPRALLSSSPSARHEKRMKRRATDALQGSPLKVSKFQAADIEEHVDDAFSDSEDVSVAVLEKRKSQKGLRDELQRLKNDVAQLAKWTEKIDSNRALTTDPKELGSFLDLLSKETSHLNQPAPRQTRRSVSSLVSRLLPFSANTPLPNREASPLPTNPYALKASSQSVSYLTAFAPLTLHTKVSRSTTSRKTIVETHTLNFTASRPFPSTLYNVSVVYETDLETQSVISVSVPTGNGSKKRRVPIGLRQWIDSRLENPLLKLDIATLCWGINRYWEASVARAQLWVQIDETYGNKAKKPSTTDFQAEVLTISNVGKLIPHLERSTMVIKPRTPSTAPRILLSNVLQMDEWMGEPQLDPDLNVSTSESGGRSNKKVNDEAKKLFHALLHANDLTLTLKVAGGAQIDAIFRSTKTTLDALFARA